MTTEGTNRCACLFLGCVSTAEEKSALLGLAAEFDVDTFAIAHVANASKRRNGHMYQHEDSDVDDSEVEDCEDCEEWPDNVRVHRLEMSRVEPWLHVRDAYCNFSAEEIRANAMNFLLDRIEADDAYSPFEDVVVLDLSRREVRSLAKAAMRYLQHGRPSGVLLGCSVDAVEAGGAGVESVRVEIAGATKGAAFLARCGPEVLGDVYHVLDVNAAKARAMSDALLERREPLAVAGGFMGVALCSASHLLKAYPKDGPKKKTTVRATFSAFPTREMDHYYRMSCDAFVIPATYTFYGSAIGMFMFKDYDIFYHNTRGYNYPVVDPFAAWTASLRHADVSVAFVPELCV